MDSVGEIRSGNHRRITTGVVDDGTGEANTVMEAPRVTWADVAKKPAAALQKPAVVSHVTKVPAFLGQRQTGIGRRVKSTTSVLERSFSSKQSS